MIDELISSGWASELVVILASALPVTELRGALPVAIKLFHLPWYQAFYLAIIGNMLPVPFLLLFFESVTKGMSRIDIGKRLVNWVFRHTRRRTAIVEKYESIGLMLFVAIPLPFTGAWTGSIAAFLCGLRFDRSLLFITLGVIISGVIVTTLTLMGWLGAIIAGVGLSSLAVLSLWKGRRLPV